jgi:hypothetical protein
MGEPNTREEFEMAMLLLLSENHKLRQNIADFANAIETGLLTIPDIKRQWIVSELRRMAAG